MWSRIHHLALLLGTTTCCVYSLQTPLPDQRLASTALSRRSQSVSTTFPEVNNEGIFSFQTFQKKQKVTDNTWAPLFGEALGTFWIVGIGSMASMSAAFTDLLTPLPEIAIVWSIAVTSAILLTTPLSGAHLNPAITLALALFRGFDWRKVVPYSAAQVLGSTAGSAFSYGVYANVIEDFEETQGLMRESSIETARVFGEYYDSSLTLTEAFGVEAFGTASLAAVVFTATHPRNLGKVPVPVSLLVGATVFSLICALAPMTQAGLNPARDFGPRIVAYLAGWTDVAFQDCWLYILAPLLGAPTGAALIDKLLYASSDNVNENDSIANESTVL